MRRPTQHTRRLGFTLVELLVVVVVIAILIGLLVPAISGAVKQANAARCTTEINNMATALAQFKNNFSDYPPSRIVLNESGNYSTTDTTQLATAFSDVRTDITLGQLSQRTVRYMTKFFPRALCFSTTGAGVKVDINGDATFQTTPIYLDGGECLVLFLGGLTTTPTVGPSAVNVDIGMNGFSRSPANPFDRTSTSRTQPLYEFNSDRLVDIDGDGFPSYNDSYAAGKQGRYYAYFSAYGSNGYDPNDCNENANDAYAKQLGDGFARAFQVNFSVNSSGYNNCYSTPSSVAVSTAPNPYTGTAAINPNGAVTWQKPQTFQIISAGADQVFGVGGQFAGNNATNKLPFPNTGTGSEIVGGAWMGGICAGGTAIDGERSTESDNLSNFSNGRLNQ